MNLLKIIEDEFKNDQNYDQLIKCTHKIRSYLEIVGDMNEVVQVISWYCHFYHHKQPVLSINSSQSDREAFKAKTAWRLSLVSEYFGDDEAGKGLSADHPLSGIDKPFEYFMLITYCKAFSRTTKQGRLRLEANITFSSNSILCDTHKGLILLRDKMIAHADWGNLDYHNQEVQISFDKVAKDMLLINQLNRTQYRKEHEYNIHDLEKCTLHCKQYCLSNAEVEFCKLKSQILTTKQHNKIYSFFCNL